MFRGKESSNRIELSRLVQDLLNFGVWGSLQLWGWGVAVWGWGVVGGCTPHTCTCTRMHACTHACTHAHVRTRMRGKHDNFMQMAAPIGVIPGNSLWCHTCVRACARVCMHVHVHMGGVHPLTTPHSHPPNPQSPGGDPPGGTPRIIQNSIALELIKIIFLFCLKIWNLWRLRHPWVGV